MDIVAPLKCGTRWIEGLNPSERLHQWDFGVSSLSVNIHSGTTFIYRPIWEHLKSAISTELNLGMDVRTIIHYIKTEKLNHWCPTLYKQLYPFWEFHSFKFHKLIELSAITPASVIREEYQYDKYEFKLPPQYESVDAILNKLDYNDITMIKQLVSSEEEWLSMMVGKRYAPLI